jgi:hypothetical protein
VALHLLGYFFCMIAVLTATAVATISFFSTSTSERVHHYPRPVVERNVTATSEEPRLFMVVPDTNDISLTKSTEANPASIPAAGPNVSIPTEKAEIKKANLTSPRCSPVCAPTMNDAATTETRRAMPKKLSTGYSVHFPTGEPRLPSPWSVEDIGACFVVKGRRQKVAYVLL